MFSSRSLRELRGVHSDMVALVRRARELSSIPFEINDGIRSLAEQKEYVRTGKSKTLKSRHLTGHAVDVRPMVDGHKNIYTAPSKVQWDALGKIHDAFHMASNELGVPHEWGGHWKSFKDGWHFQLPWKEYPTGSVGSKIRAPFKTELFDQTVRPFTLRWEGGVSEHPRDPGGLTNKGITRGTLSTYLGRQATREEVLNLSDKTWMQIARKMYWDIMRCDEYKADGVSWALFDMGWAHGTGAAPEMLQTVLGVEQDGIIGPITLKAANERDPVKLIQDLTDYRIRRARGFKTWDVFGKGWTARWKELERFASALEYTREPVKQPLTTDPRWWEYGAGVAVGLIVKTLFRRS